MGTNYTDFEDLPKKQQQIITAAGELFGKHGVRRVTVQEICDNASISKMTFYKFFSNKWDLAKSVMESLAALEIEFYHFIIEGDVPFPQKVEDILRLALARIYGVGLGKDFYDDVSNEASPLYDYYREQQRKSRAMVADFLEDGQNNGHLDKSIEMPFLLFVFQRLSELVKDPEFIQIKPDLEERIQDVSALFFHGFSKI
jgi:AcrR family transcriptional regulator